MTDQLGLFDLPEPKRDPGARFLEPDRQTRRRTTIVREHERVIPEPKPRPSSPSPEAQRAASVAAGVEGAARAHAGADPEWIEAARLAIRRTAEAREEFTSDDVWEVGELPRTRDNRALGPQMTWAMRQGWIVSTDRIERTRQAKSHGSPARIWVSLLLGSPLPTDP